MTTRKLILLMHESLDGRAAGPKGEMDWILVDDEIFGYVEQRLRGLRTALYGRVTYQMMEGYWPTAASQPNASRHDIEHAVWYEQADKIVLSRTLTSARQPSTRIIGADAARQVRELKRQPGTDIVIFGSPGASHSLMAEGLIDEYWLFVNPTLVGPGIPVFEGLQAPSALKLLESTVFSSGVVFLHYGSVSG
jgi:dihydrofolate reductase